MESNPKIKSLNALICQIKPIFKNKAQNIDRIKSSLQKYSEAHKLDLLMFPQMAFIGYNFKNYDDIVPYTEFCGQGESFEFCQKEAIRLNAYVIYGYAQKEKQSNFNQNQQKYFLYNSVCVIDRTGSILINTRKTHMYESDQLWCCEGPGFNNIIIYNSQNQPIKCSIGICMDINPKGFKSGKYELADYIIENQSQVLLFISAWNDHEPNAKDEEKSQMGIVNYWINRLLPIIQMPEKQKKSLLVLVCNRTGEQITYTNNKEGKTNFIGTSCLFRVNPHQLIQKLGKKEEDYLNVSTWIMKK